MNAPTLAVSRSYLDRVVAHHLALSVRRRGSTASRLARRLPRRSAAPTGNPRAWTLRETLARLIAEIPETMRGARGARNGAAKKQTSWPTSRLVAQSWFEDDPDIAQAIEAHAAVIARSLPAISCRASWRGVVTDGPIFLRTALWMREAPPEVDLCWRELGDRCQSARRRTGHDRDRVDARYRVAHDRGAPRRRALFLTAPCDRHRIPDERAGAVLQRAKIRDQENRRGRVAEARAA